MAAVLLDPFGACACDEVGGACKLVGEGEFCAGQDPPKAVLLTSLVEQRRDPR